MDIRDVKIDRSLPVEERMKSYVEQIKNPYLFKVGKLYLTSKKVMSILSQKIQKKLIFIIFNKMV